MDATFPYSETRLAEIQIMAYCRMSPECGLYLYRTHTGYVFCWKDPITNKSHEAVMDTTKRAVRLLERFITDGRFCKDDTLTKARQHLIREIKNNVGKPPGLYVKAIKS